MGPMPLGWQGEMSIPTLPSLPGAAPEALRWTVAVPSANPTLPEDLEGLLMTLRWVFLEGLPS